MSSGGDPKAKSVEQWRPVPGYEGHYEVSDLGRVRSIPRRVKDSLGRYFNRSGRLLTGSVQKGYPTVSLGKDGKQTFFQTHRLVCIAFWGPCPSGDHVVAHNNDNKADCRAINLRWATRSENTQDAYRNGIIKRKLTDEQAIDIRRRYMAGEPALKLSNEFGVSDPMIRRIARGEAYKHIKNTYKPPLFESGNFAPAAKAPSTSEPQLSLFNDGGINGR